MILDTIRRLLKELFANSVLFTCPHFWELYAVGPHCTEGGCPWREKCPFFVKEKPRITRDVLLRIISEFDPSALEEMRGGDV